MTETASSLMDFRIWSGMLVRSIISWRESVSSALPNCKDGLLVFLRTEGCLGLSSACSSPRSSSISVVSVPFEVTGDGPTISLLGLIK